MTVMMMMKETVAELTYSTDSPPIQEFEVKQVNVYITRLAVP